jgi:hypothetical protein
MEYVAESVDLRDLDAAGGEAPRTVRSSQAQPFGH